MQMKTGSGGEEFILSPRVKKTPMWSLLPGVALAIISGICIVSLWDINEFESESSFIRFLGIPIALGSLVVFGLPPLLQHSSPKVMVSVDKTQAQMGEVINITHRIIGPVHRLRRLRITFEGVESKWEGQRAKGVPKSQTTWRPARERCFIQEPVLDTSDGSAMVFGQHTMTVPSTTVPTIAIHDGSLRIEWWFRVWGDTIFLPNVDERFPIDVRSA